MLIFESKISGCVPCFVFISPLFCALLLINVTQVASSYSNISAIMYDNTKQPSDINSSHEENSILGENRPANNMNRSNRAYNSSIYPDLSYPLTTSKDSTSWSDQLWNQLQYNMKNNLQRKRTTCTTCTICPTCHIDPCPPSFLTEPHPTSFLPT